MATYTIVEVGKDPLGANEIHAGDTIQVTDGDVFIIDPAVDETTVFESASGSATDFEIVFAESNSNSFTIELKKDLSPDITVGDSVDISSVEIKADKTDAVTLTAGDGVTLGKYIGSESGADTIMAGDGFSTAYDIYTKDGDDVFVFGNDAAIQKIDAGDGDNTIIFGNDASVTDIRTGEGHDAIAMGDGASVQDIDTGKGDDTIVVGDNFDGDQVLTQEGDDIVIIGSGASFGVLDGGSGADSISSGTELPGAQNFENIICFARGTRILTDRGELPVERLRTSDLVFTLDHGSQPIRWIGSTGVDGRGALAPVKIEKGALGNTRDLLVSQQHRMLVGGWRAELLFGEPEILVAAKHMVNGDNVEVREVAEIEYFHMLFDRHEIVFAEGIPSESFHPAEAGLDTLTDGAREEIFVLFPKLRANPTWFGQSARVSLKSYEGRLMAA